MTVTRSQSDSVPEGQEFFNSFYIGINIENILYGIELFLYFKTIRVLLRNGRKKKLDLFYALFSTMMVLLVTVWVATQAVFGEEMWLIHADFPGGPSAYWRKYIAIWYIDWGATAIVILQLMTDALMIYRCRIIWSDYRVIVIPIILWFITFALGVLVDWTTSTPGGDYFTGLSIPLSLAYWSVSVFLSVILTCMICSRVLQHGRMVREYLGYHHAIFYFTVVEIIVESLLPYTVAGIAALVSLGVESSTSVMFVSVYFMMMCISNHMLILRVVEGKAWRNNTFSPSIINFNLDSNSIDPSMPRWLHSHLDGARVQLQTPSNVYFPDGHDKARILEV